MRETKKIAIIGGGSAGLITAYFLHKDYEITLFERDKILGGNVRTLNKNVKGTALKSSLNIENGVLGFSRNYYPKFHKLLDHLQISYTSYKPSVLLFNERHFFPVDLSYFTLKTFYKVLTASSYRRELFGFIKSKDSLESQISASSAKHLAFKDLIFQQSLFEKHTKALLMLSFSTPFELVSQLPQSLLNPYYLSLPGSRWSFIKGGVFSYIEAILKRTSLKVVCNATNIKITRYKNGVNLNCNGESLDFDKIVIATTPGSVKKILADMTEIEQDIFGDWESQRYPTTAHTDNSFYGEFKHIKKTPMDLFYKFSDATIGYNSCQNIGYKIPGKTDYSFAYGLDNLINPNRVLDQQNHEVTKYMGDHDSRIDKLKHINGRNNTFYAGAYLDNGLHEGAVVSALSVSSMLNGVLFT